MKQFILQYLLLLRSDMSFDLRFPLFDMNAKDRVQPILTSISGFSTWPGFRKSLSICREASSESELRTLWRSMVDEWLPLSEKTKDVRMYLEKYI